MNCAECLTKECYHGKNCTPCKDEITEKFTGRNLETMRTASHIESRYYKKKTRMEETVLYAQKMGYKKLGLVFCVGLSEEARKIQKILAEDFDVVSVCCKVCGISKDEYSLEKIEDGFEASCNPIGQATIVNKEGTDFNIVIGLCVGHDVLFYSHSKAPVTTLAVKDRVLAHSPLGAIYSAYY
ncbi:MAG: hypothetical protein AYK19_06985 [Theionarchaea archaeon DG-70-1]|nr:MAG: hypothetical protein AYK19_06985 [Theionarchaea archaeon DG-70-1]